MSQDDPFAEPDDSERTVVRPNPGGRRGSVAAPAPGGAPAHEPTQPEPSRAAAPASSGSGDGSMGAGLTGLNPLNASAATLFSLVSRIRNRAQHSDPDALRRSVVAEIRNFESRAIAAGVDARDVKVARYAICATVDDVVLNTPWGGTSIWAQQSMVGTFHRETVGGDRFYDLLARLEQDPANNIQLLEFLYMCLSLGFEGRLRVEDRGAERHMTIRAGLARIIRSQRGDIEHDLSPHWEGIDRRHKPLSAWKPVWIAVACVALLLAGAFTGLSYALSNQTSSVIGRFAALEPPGVATLDRPAPPVEQKVTVPEQDDQLQRVSGFLQQEIDEGLVDVFPDANTLTIRLAGAGMFASGSTTLQKKFDVPLQRVAAALNDTGGPVIVVGYTDNVPIRSSRFDSNQELSLARAESVQTRLAAQIQDPARLKAEGRGDKNPIASNDTSGGRAANRRIEILLIRQEAG